MRALQRQQPPVHPTESQGPVRGRSSPRAAVVLAFTSALLLAACGSNSSSTGSEFLNTSQTKAAIEESILSQRHIHTSVVCPTEVVREKGVTFQCVATTPNGVKTIFHVVEANSRGYVEYSSTPETGNKPAQSRTTKSTIRHKKP